MTNLKEEGLYSEYRKEIKDENDEIIKDYTKDSTKVIVLDTSKAKCVEVIYNKDSRMCDDLENLCNCNTEK